MLMVRLAYGPVRVPIVHTLLTGSIWQTPGLLMDTNGFRHPTIAGMRSCAMQKRTVVR